MNSVANNVRSIDEAKQRLEKIFEGDTDKILDLCKYILMEQPQKAEKVIVLVHGYTNCPQQFRQLGELFYKNGYTVLIAPLPHHGLADLLNEEHAKLKAEELIKYADNMIDIANGFGNEIVMMGISLGGVLTAWAAQNRPDIDLAVLISPMFGFRQIPTFLTAAIMNIYSALPDQFIWWDPEKKAEGPQYAYPRYSRHALTQGLRLGFSVISKAYVSRPAAKKIAVVLNPNDQAVNNGMTRSIAKLWEEKNTNVLMYELSSDFNVGHDLIDPHQPDANIALVYPFLLDVVEKEINNH